jgi:hypothetical protein
MSGLIDWLRRFGQMVGLPAKPSRQALVVERLEPRQMLAVDCFFMVEIRPAELDFHEACVADTYVAPWASEGVRDAEDGYAEDLTGGSVLDDLEEYYLIYLEDVLDEIGELWEVQETSFGAFDDLNFSWFS